MNALRQFSLFAGHSWALARLVVVLLPLILAACSNGGSGGGGY